MIAAPGAEFLAIPFPNNMNANRIPSPGPGLVSIKKNNDFPASADCWIPNGEKTPWLIALFKNKIFAGSTIIEVNGNKLL